MKKTQKCMWVCLILAFLVLGFSRGVHSGGKVPAGHVAMHVVGWFYQEKYGEDAEAMGYFTYIEGIPGPFFAASAGGPTQSCLFTFRVRAPMPEPMQGDYTTTGRPIFWQQRYRYKDFLLEVYHYQEPQFRDPCDPETFSVYGTLIATFNIVGAQTIYIPTGTLGEDERLVRVTMSAELDESVDFKDLFPGGVTFTIFYNERWNPCTEGSEMGTQMFAGSSIAIEGAIKEKEKF